MENEDFNGGIGMVTLSRKGTKGEDFSGRTRLEGTKVGKVEELIDGSGAGRLPM